MLEVIRVEGGGTNGNVRRYTKVIREEHGQNHKSGEDLCVPSEWNQRLWKLRSLEKEVHGKTKGYGHKQSQVRNIGNGLASLRLRGRVSGSKKTPETQGSEHTGDIMRDGS